jgi:glutathione S-transferase
MTTAQSFVALVALLAAALYTYTSVLVGQARVKFNIAAPAITGHPEFERTYRVQMNTLETLPVFLLCLFLFSFYVNAWIAAVLGAIWIVGRYLYMQAYIKAAEGRSQGFTIQGAAVILLLLGSFIGVLWDILT